MINILRLYANRLSIIVFLIGMASSFFSRSYFFDSELSLAKVSFGVGMVCVAFILMLRLLLQIFAKEAFLVVRSNRLDLMAVDEFKKVDSRVKLVLAIQTIGLLSAFFTFGWIFTTVIFAL